MCLSRSVGRASRLESMRRWFESHLSAAFSLKKVVSGLVLCCVELLCVALSFFLSFSLFVFMCLFSSLDELIADDFGFAFVLICTCCRAHVQTCQLPNSFLQNNFAGHYSFWQDTTMPTKYNRAANNTISSVFLRYIINNSTDLNGF